MNWPLRALGQMGPTEKAIRRAMWKWEYKTCIKFKERTTETDYIDFIADTDSYDK